MILITLIPSIYFGYGLIQKEKFTERASQFVQSISVFEGNFLLKNEINAAKKTITLIYGGNSLTDVHKGAIKERGKAFNLEKAEIVIQQGFSFSDFNENLSEIDNLKGEVNRLTHLLQEKEKEAREVANKSALGNQLLNEIKPLFPQLESCFYSEALISSEPSKLPQITPVIIFINRKTGKLANNDKKKIEVWLKNRLQSDKIYIIFN